MTPLLAASAGNVLVWFVWVLAAGTCLLSGVAVVSFADPFYSALGLIANLGSLGVLYLLLSAEFVAAAQVMIYAGAVVVMFLFVIAYVSGRTDTPWRGSPSIQTWAAIAAATAILAEVLVVIGIQAGGGELTTEADITAAFGSPAAIGELFLTDHLLAFEITSIVLLVAAVGGVILGYHARRSDDDRDEGATG